MKIYTVDQQFPQPIGQYISQITEKSYCLKLLFLRPNLDLIVWIQQY